MVALQSQETGTWQRHQACRCDGDVGPLQALVCHDVWHVSMLQKDRADHRGGKLRSWQRHIGQGGNGRRKTGPLSALKCRKL